MLDLVLQVGEIQDSLTTRLGSILEQITPELPHTTFVTDLAIIMIIASIITLAFFKIRQPLIIGYLFAGMLIGPLSPLWSRLLPEGGPDAPNGVGILSDVGALNLFAEIGVYFYNYCSTTYGECCCNKECIHKFHSKCTCKKYCAQSGKESSASSYNYDLAN